MIIKLLTEPHLEFLSLKGGCRGSSESTLDLKRKYFFRKMFIVADLVFLTSELAGAGMMPIGISSTCQYLS